MMKRGWVVVMAGVGAAALWGAGAVPAGDAASAWAVPAARGAVPASGSLGRAVGVPGLAALNKGASAGVDQVSCGSAGSCAAVGSYRLSDGHNEGFVASQKNGVWGAVTKVAGLAGLNKGGQASVSSVSCSAQRSCTAGGDYSDRSGQLHGFVVSEQNGVWGRAAGVPGLAALGRETFISSVSCGSAGNCAAGGNYLGTGQHGFVAVERNGVWGRAIEVPGLAALTHGRTASVQSVSCASAGSCAAAGSYRYIPGHDRGFVAVERNGVWSQAIAVPGLAALATVSSEVEQVSCGSAGNCAAGGVYVDGIGNRQGFAAIETKGVWGRAIEVPGLATLNEGGEAEVSSVSCAAPGNCALGGSYSDQQESGQGFVVRESNGVWGRAAEVSGLGALNKAGDASVSSVSCATPGNCAAGGSYTDQHGHVQGFVVRESNGVWGQAAEVSGLGALNKAGDAGVNSVSCATPGSCAAGGFYSDRDKPRRFQGFVTQP